MPSTVYAACRDFLIMLNIVMLNAFMLNAFMLNAFMLNAFMLNAIMLSVVMLNVLAPRKDNGYIGTNPIKILLKFTDS